MKPKFLTPLIAVACIVSTQGQTLADPPLGKQAIYSAVPPKDRESLRQATEKFVTVRESEKWEEVYVMLNNEQHQTKDQFVKRMQRAARLIDFTPLSVEYYRPAAWVITGCAAFEPPPHKRGAVFAKLNAYHVGGAWLFSDVGVAVADEAGRIRPCTARSKPGDPA